MTDFLEYFKTIYHNISFFDVENSKNNDDKDFTILINRYVFIASIIFVMQSISNYVFFGYTKEAMYLLLIFILFASSYFTLKKLRKNKYLILFVFIILNIVITYYSSFCGIESGLYLFYFPLLTALPLFFSFKEKKKLLFLFFSIILTFYISAFYNFNLFPRNPELNGYEYRLLILNITCVIIFLIINFIYLEEKRNSYYYAINRDNLRHMHIKQLKNELANIKSSIDKREYSKEEISDILNAIRLNDVLFLEKFEKLFPGYLDTIKSKTEGKLSLSDLKYCGMIRLGLTTKQIAIHTNTSIKAVEGKKYRIRKKFSDLSDQENKNFFLE